MERRNRLEVKGKKASRHLWLHRQIIILFERLAGGEILKKVIKITAKFSVPGCSGADSSRRLEVVNTYVSRCNEKNTESEKQKI